MGNDFFSIFVVLPTSTISNVNEFFLNRLDWREWMPKGLSGFFINVIQKKNETYKERKKRGLQKPQVTIQKVCDKD